MSKEKIDTLHRRAPIEAVNTQWLSDSGVQLDILRLDKLDPQISGNKWYKLKRNLQFAGAHEKNTILSFGGAWSNHIHALAAAGHRFGFSTIGVIRGDPLAENGRLSATLEDAVNWGMTLRFLSRHDYRRKQDPDFLTEMQRRFGLQEEDVHIVPEGGSNALGAFGCQDIISSAEIQPGSYDEIWLACGTGATLSGIALAAEKSLPDTNIKGVAVLKGAGFLNKDMYQFIECSLDNWTLLTDYHYGGHSRTSKELLAFIDNFEQETGIVLDPVYTGKTMFALHRTCDESAELYRGRRLFMVHTRGLQGCRGFNMHY